MNKYDDPLSLAAAKLGRSKGEDFANLLIDRGTDVEEAEALIWGYEEGREEAMSLCPNPLSGEWADDDTPMSAMNEIAGLAESEGLLRKANIEEALNAAEDLLDTFEEAYREGFWETALKRAKEIVEAA